MAARFPVDPSDLSTSYAATESDSSSSLLVHNHRLTVDFFEGYPPRHTILHPGTKKRRKKRSGCCCGRFLIAALGVCAFLLIWFVLSRHFGLRDFGFTPTRTRGNRTNEEVREFLAKLVDGRRIRENNRWLSERPHVAGSEEQRGLMQRIEEEFRQLGFHVRTHEYDVLLSAPDYDRPNRIHAFVNDQWLEVSDGLASGEPTADGRERHLWNAYAANGTAVGECVFANYGTNEDFDRLKELGISVAGRIALMRFGANFRGEKVRNAEERGAIGVILYPDPAEFALDRPLQNGTFPTQTWLPAGETQRGTLLRTNGDPQTPLLPSRSYVDSIRLTHEELRSSGVIPRIPVMPIGYGDAEKIMSVMDGVEAPWAEWTGGMPTVYRLNGSVLFRLDVHGRLVHSTIKNVIAKFVGEQQPDKWVLLTNHVDAWTKGAVDPSAGTAVMLELARVVSETSRQTGWRPHRSLVFCAFDAEEFGLIGSTEYVEEMLKTLQQRAVAVLNVDNINGNTTLAIKASPLLYDVLMDAAAAVPQPNEAERAADRATLLDSWRFHGTRGSSLFRLPSFGSDFQPFLSYAGIPVADLRLTSAPAEGFSFYHTSFETIEAVERLIDPTGEIFVSMARFWAEAALRLADSPVLPFNVGSSYGIFLTEQVRRLDVQLAHLGVDEAIGMDVYRKQMDALDHSIAAFRSAALRLEKFAEEVDEADVGLLHAINERLQHLEGCFVFEQGVFDDPLQRNLIFAPSRHRDVFPSVPFAGILDPAIDFARAPERSDRLRAVRTGIARLQYAMDSATHLLLIDDLFF